MNEHAEPSSPVPLGESRPLNARERALVDWLLHGSADSPELRAQADSASVVARCSCGCPSVFFEVPSTVSVAQLDSADPQVRHGEDLSLTAEASAPDGRPLEVSLHVIAGRLVELEVWAGIFGGDPRTELPDIHTLRR